MNIELHMLPPHSKHTIKGRFDNLANSTKLALRQGDTFWELSQRRIYALCAIIEVLENCDQISPRERVYMYDCIDYYSKILQKLPLDN